MLLLAVPNPYFGELAILIGRLQVATGIWLPGASLLPLLTLPVVPILLFHMLVTELRAHPVEQPAWSWPMRLGSTVIRVPELARRRISPGTRQGADVPAPAVSLVGPS
jgi:hypothetical protein